jgi:hypothetical protein
MQKTKEQGTIVHRVPPRVELIALFRLHGPEVYRAIALFAAICRPITAMSSNLLFG